MEKEDWINSILESVSGIKQVESNPYLYQKIVHRINQAVTDSTPRLKYKIGWALVFFIVIVGNVSAFAVYKSKIDKQKESAAIEALSSEMISNSTYNY
jgi:hypothetical protein